jgi:hypothetical protein
MIKFLITHPETKRIILGLVITETNVERLKKDQPIHFHAEDLGLKEFKYNEFLLIYYPTLEEAEKDLRDKGYITSDTHIQDFKTKVN